MEDEVWDENLYKNWVRGAKGLEFLQEGLNEFVGDKALVCRDQQLRIITKVPIGPLLQCIHCTSENLLPEHSNLHRACDRTTCIHKTASNCFGSRPRGRRKCPNGICSELYDAIVIDHFYNDPLWKNSYPGTWSSDPHGWSYMKCFETTKGPGTSAQKTDASGLLSILINNRSIQNWLACHNMGSNVVCPFYKARSIRNDILHKSKLELDDHSLDEYIDAFITVLEDPKCLLSYVGSQDAVQKLQQLKSKQINISQMDEKNILKIRKEALAELEEKKNEALTEMQDSICIGLSDLNTKKADALYEMSEERNEALEEIKNKVSTGLTDLNTKKADALHEMSEERNEALEEIKNKVSIGLTDLNTNRADALHEMTKERNETLEEIKDKVSIGLTDLNTNRADALHEMSEERNEALEEIKDKVSTGLTDLNTNRADALHEMSEERNKALEEIKDKVSTGLTDLNTNRADALQEMSNERNEALEEVKDKVSTGLTDLNANRADALKEMSKERYEASEEIKNEVSTGLTDLNTKRTNTLQDMSEGRNQALEQIKDKINTGLTELNEKSADALKQISSETTEVVDKIKDTARAIIAEATDGRKEAVQKISAAGTEVLETIYDRHQHILTDIEEAKSNLLIKPTNYEPLSAQVKTPVLGEDEAFLKMKAGKTRWTDCIAEKDVNAANMLIQQGTFPSNSELIQAFYSFGKEAETFQNICNMICTYIKYRSNNVLDTWASYRFKYYDEQGQINIVFVVLTKDHLVNIDVHGYNTLFRCVTDFSKESDIVLKNEVLDVTPNIPNEQEVLKQLKRSISDYADDLLKEHSNISVISPSFKRSVGYSSAHHRILDEPCIAVYVPIKGFIPIQETPLPKTIDGYYVDVLEGEFVSFTGRSTDFHHKLKMGLAIHAKIDAVPAGTLGAFIDHPNYGLCGITCAHVVSTLDELIGKGTCYCPSNRLVFQPVSRESKMFGNVVCIINHEGSELTPGMEVAVIKIHERHPENGSFPVALNYHEAGFDDDNPPTYNSGEVRETSAIKPKTQVFKFGMATGITRGCFGLDGSVIRIKDFKGTCSRNSFGYCLKNQMVILKIGDNPFASFGDSGSLVLIEGDQNDSVAIGLVEGGINGRVFVTPICDILRELNCTPIRMKQFNINCILGSHEQMEISQT